MLPPFWNVRIPAYIRSQAGQREIDTHARHVCAWLISNTRESAKEMLLPKRDVRMPRNGGGLGRFGTLLPNAARKELFISAFHTRQAGQDLCDTRSNAAGLVQQHPWTGASAQMAPRGPLPLPRRCCGGQ